MFDEKKKEYSTFDSTIKSGNDAAKKVFLFFVVLVLICLLVYLFGFFKLTENGWMFENKIKKETINEEVVKKAETINEEVVKKAETINKEKIFIFNVFYTKDYFKIKISYVICLNNNDIIKLSNFQKVSLKTKMDEFISRFEAIQIAKNREIILDIRQLINNEIKKIINNKFYLIDFNIEFPSYFMERINIIRKIEQDIEYQKKNILLNKIKLEILKEEEQMKYEMEMIKAKNRR